jgi:hypothetical protein
MVDLKNRNPFVTGPRTMEDGWRLFGEDYTAVRYEDLLERPEAEIGRLAGFLGADTDARVVERTVAKTTSRSCPKAESAAKRTRRPFSGRAWPETGSRISPRATVGFSIKKRGTCSGGSATRGTPPSPGRTDLRTNHDRQATKGERL